MSSKVLVRLGFGILAVCLAAPVPAQEAAAEAAATPAAAPQMGPASIPDHWSKYDYPDSIPEGTPYHVIVKGDTLWDLAGAYLGTPYLWPQIWDNNKYISDAHWIYPGDPMLLPQLAVVADSAGEPSPEGMDEDESEDTGSAEMQAARLFPISEEISMECGGRIVATPEDAALTVTGHEEGPTKIAFSERDIVYLSQGSASGVRAGDVFTAQRPSYEVKHPDTHKKMGRKLETTGRVRVLMVQENSATAVVEESCQELLVGDYLTTYERATVPLAEATQPPDSQTPASGKAQGYVVDIDNNLVAAAEGHLVTVDLGSEAGVAPGSRLLAFREDEETANRRVLGELAILIVHGETALAKLTYSVDALYAGDRVEIR